MNRKYVYPIENLYCTIALVSMKEWVTAQSTPLRLAPNTQIDTISFIVDP